MSDGSPLEDRSDYAESFRFYERGNTLEKRELRYPPELTERNARLQAALFTPEFLAARFIDKTPNKFRRLGLIHLILSNARIIDARREAMARCFSNFKQLFAPGQEFTYSFEDIARYYRGYVELMAYGSDRCGRRSIWSQHPVDPHPGHMHRGCSIDPLPFHPMKGQPSCPSFKEFPASS